MEFLSYGRFQYEEDMTVLWLFYPRLFLQRCYCAYPELFHHLHVYPWLFNVYPWLFILGCLSWVVLTLCFGIFFLDLFYCQAIDMTFWRLFCQVLCRSLGFRLSFRFFPKTSSALKKSGNTLEPSGE